MIQNESLYALLIISLFAWVDTIREYSIWHVFEIRMLPKVSIIVAVLLVVLGMISQKKTINH